MINLLAYLRMKDKDVGHGGEVYTAGVLQYNL